MALSKGAVKTSIRATIDANISNVHEENSRDAFAEMLAEVICNAVKSGVESALYDAGLIAPGGGGPVTGAIGLSLTISE